MADKVSGGRLCLEFSGKIYDREAVRLAGHIFAERCAVKIIPGKGSVKVSFPGAADADLLAGEMANEVLNQQCRLDLSKKNSRIAGIILARAFLSACGEKIKRTVAGAKK